MNDVARVPRDQRQTEYWHIQQEYIKRFLEVFKEMFERKDLLNSCGVQTTFHHPLRRIQIESNRVPIQVLPKVEETTENLFKK